MTARPQLLLDTSALVYRAFFAWPRTMTDPQGRSVNAVRGYVEMLSRLLQDWRPREMVSVFDADWRPAWRVALYAGYKATRAPDPPELPPQFDMIAELLDAAGLPAVEQAGYEADDVIGSLAARAREPERVAIVTGDRDLLQLVRDPIVEVLFTVKGVGTLARFDAAAVRRKYRVPPERYADFAILRGDPSDGLPGLPGIGEKRAADIVANYGGLDDLIAPQAKLPARLAATIAASRPYLRAMSKIVPVVTDLPVEVPPARPPDAQRLRELAARLDIAGPVSRLQEALAAN